MCLAIDVSAVEKWEPGSVGSIEADAVPLVEVENGLGRQGDAAVLWKVRQGSGGVRAGSDKLEMTQTGFHFSPTVQAETEERRARKSNILQTQHLDRPITRTGRVKSCRTRYPTKARVLKSAQNADKLHLSSWRSGLICGLRLGGDLLKFQVLARTLGGSTRTFDAPCSCLCSAAKFDLLLCLTFGLCDSRVCSSVTEVERPILLG